MTDPVLSDGAANYTPATSEKRGGVTSHYMHDRMGTLNRVINSAQTNTHTRAYDAFGMLTSSAGTSATPFGYAGAWGYQEDGDSGLKLLGHRYYDASTGRFLTKDHAKDGRNWYTYCHNSPSYFIDGNGLWVFAAVVVALGLYGLYELATEANQRIENGRRGNQRRDHEFSLEEPSLDNYNDSLDDRREQIDGVRDMIGRQIKDQYVVGPVVDIVGDAGGVITRPAEPPFVSNTGGEARVRYINRHPRQVYVLD